MGFAVMSLTDAAASRVRSIVENAGGEAKGIRRQLPVEALLDQVGNRMGHDAVGSHGSGEIGEEKAPEPAGAQRRRDRPWARGRT